MEIDSSILALYIEGKASLDQITYVKSWAEENEENMAEILALKKAYAASLLVKPQVNKRSIHRIQATRCLLYRIAAAVILFAGLSFGFKSLYDGKNDETAATTVSVPAGQRVSVVLPDGSLVWLNSGTSLQYASDFEKHKKREVKVDGMAYFEIERDEKKPFVVHTYLMDVEVLGTKFDLNADSSRGTFETSLLQGKVKVTSPTCPKSSIDLEVNHRVYLKDGRLKVGRIEDYEVFKWTQGIYSFKDKHLSEILTDLGRYYGKEIYYRPDEAIEKETLTSKFRISDGLDYALEVLQSTFHFTFTKNQEDNIIYIETNK